MVRKKSQGTVKYFYSKRMVTCHAFSLTDLFISRFVHFLVWANFSGSCLRVQALYFTAQSDFLDSRCYVNFWMIFVFFWVEIVFLKRVVESPEVKRCDDFVKIFSN